MIENKTDIEQKIKKLTIEGARDFWNEICEWLDALSVGCDRKYDNAKTWEEFREAQILKRVCKQMKKLPENMVLTLRAQLAGDTAGDMKSVLDRFNFAVPGVKPEVKDG